MWTPCMLREVTANGNVARYGLREPVMEISYIVLYNDD
jgi:hypothetical protein